MIHTTVNILLVLYILYVYMQGTQYVWMCTELLALGGKSVAN